MLVMVFTYRLRVLPAFGAAGLRRRLPPAGRAPGRPAPPPRAPARHPHADRHRRHRALRARRDARRRRRAVRDGGAGQGAVARRRVTLRHVLRNALIPVAHPARPLASRALLRRRLHRGDLRLARRRPGAGRGGPGARLPGRDGGDGGERGARRARQPARRRCWCAGSIRGSRCSMGVSARAALAADRRARLRRPRDRSACSPRCRGLLAPLLAGDPIAQRDDRARPGSCRRSPPTRSAPSTCSAPTGSGATCGRACVYGARVSLGVGDARRAPVGARRRRGRSGGGVLARAGSERRCSGSPTSRWRCRGSCCCCSWPRCGSRARGW